VTRFTACPAYTSRRGQLFLWLLLGAAVERALAPRNVMLAERVHYLSIFGWLTPESVIASQPLATTLACVVIGSACCWAIQFALPLSSWLCASAFLLMSAFAVERSFYTPHQSQFVAIGLLCFAAFYQARAAEIRASARFLRVGRLLTVPQWLYSALLAYASLAYTYSGVTKLLRGGVQWANGTSLQLWVANAPGAIGDPFGRLIMASHGLARTLQIAVLIAETLAAPSLMYVSARRLVGLTLLGFHLGSESVFGFHFYGNILVLVFVFVLEPHSGKAESGHGRSVAASGRANDEAEMSSARSLTASGSAAARSPSRRRSRRT